MKFIVYYIIFLKNSKINIKTFLYFSKIIVINNFLNLKNSQFSKVKKSVLLFTENYFYQFIINIYFK